MTVNSDKIQRRRWIKEYFSAVKADRQCEHRNLDTFSDTLTSSVWLAGLPPAASPLSFRPRACRSCTRSLRACWRRHTCTDPSPTWSPLWSPVWPPGPSARWRSGRRAWSASTSPSSTSRWEWGRRPLWQWRWRCPLWNNRWGVRTKVQSLVVNFTFTAEMCLFVATLGIGRKLKSQIW